MPGREPCARLTADSERQAWCRLSQYQVATNMDAESTPSRRFVHTVTSEIEIRLRAFAAAKEGWVVSRTSAVSLTLSGPGEEHNFLVGLANAWDPVQEDGDLVGIHVACGAVGCHGQHRIPLLPLRPRDCGQPSGNRRRERARQCPGAGRHDHRPLSGMAHHLAEGVRGNG